MGKELVGGEYIEQVQIVTSDGTVVDSFGGSGGATGGLTDAQLRASPVPVSGSFSVTGTLTNTELRAADVKVSLDGETVGVTGPLTDTQLRASMVPVRTDPTSVTSIYDGGRTAAVTAANALKVDGSAVTQPVSGPLTDTQLRATAVPVSGTVTATGPLTDTQLRATAVPVSGPLTDTQLRATAVPVSGTVTATGPLTDTQLRATAVPVSIGAALPAGTNAIGKLAANSGVDIGDVDVLSVPATITGPLGATTDAAASITVDEDTTARSLVALLKALKNMTIDVSASNAAIQAAVESTAASPVYASAETSSVYNGSSALTPKFAVIDHATSGNNTVVAAVTSKKIRVLAAFLVAAGTATARFESGADGTALTGQMNLIANTGFVLPFSPVGWFETAAGTLLNLELSAAVSVDGSIVYVEV